MVYVTKRFIIFILILITGFLILFSYFFTGSRADRLTSNEEYIKSLEEASRGKQLAGQQPLPMLSPTQATETEQAQPNNLFEELIFQIKALFKAR